MIVLPEWLRWAAEFLYWDKKIDSAAGWSSCYFAAQQRDQWARKFGIAPRISVRPHRLQDKT